MKKFISKLKATHHQLNEVSFTAVGYKNVIKALIGTIILLIISMIPFIIIFVELLKLFSPIHWFYYLLLAVIFIGLLLIVPYGSILFYSILKNYTQKEEVKVLKNKDIFIAELFNPLYLIVAIMFIVILNFYLG